MKTVNEFLKENGFLKTDDEGFYYSNSNDKGNFILDILNERLFNVEIRENKDALNKHTASCTWYEYRHPEMENKIRIIVCVDNHNKIDMYYVVIDYEN